MGSDKRIGREFLKPVPGYGGSCFPKAEAIEDVDLCVLAVEWDEFVRFPLAGYRKTLRNPILVDFRNVFSLEAMAEAGFDHHSIGRASVRMPASRTLSFSS